MSEREYEVETITKVRKVFLVKAASVNQAMMSMQDSSPKAELMENMGEEISRISEIREKSKIEIPLTTAAESPSFGLGAVYKPNLNR